MARHQRPGIYGLMAEFDDPSALVVGDRRAHDAGYRRMDAYSPFPIEELHEALGSHHTRLPLIVLIGGIIGCLGGYALQYWVVDDRLPAQHRRQAAAQLAGVHSGDLRVHDSGRGVVGGVRHAGAQRPADAVSPGVQRAALRAGEPQPLLSLHRGDRPEVRSAGDAAVPGAADVAGGDDSCGIARPEPRETPDSGGTETPSHGGVWRRRVGAAKRRAVETTRKRKGIFNPSAFAFPCGSTSDPACRAGRRGDDVATL